MPSGSRGSDDFYNLVSFYRALVADHHAQIFSYKYQNKEINAFKVLEFTEISGAKGRTFIFVSTLFSSISGYFKHAFLFFCC